MRLTYSYVYSYENKHNPIGGTASNNLKKIILQLFVRLFVYSHKNNIKLFWYCSQNIFIKLLRSKKNRQNICCFWRQSIENEWTNKVWLIKQYRKSRLEKDTRMVNRVTTNGTANPNEWQRVTTNDKEWYNKNISLTTFFAVDDFFSFPLINIQSLISHLLHPSFFRGSRRRCSVTNSSSYNLITAISRVLIGEQLIFCTPPWPTRVTKNGQMVKCSFMN